MNSVIGRLDNRETIVGKMIKGAMAGALALGCLAAVPMEASAMPVAGVVQSTDAGAAQGAEVQNVYWRYGWRRPYYGYGWRRPYAFRYGWRRPFWPGPRRFYRW